MISAVAESDEPADAGTLAESLAIVETADEGVDARTRKSPHVALTQRHLDQLDELGAVDYDDRAKTVESTALTDDLAKSIWFIESVCE